MFIEQLVDASSPNASSLLTRHTCRFVQHDDVFILKQDEVSELATHLNWFWVLVITGLVKPIHRSVPYTKRISALQFISNIFFHNFAVCFKYVD